MIYIYIKLELRFRFSSTFTSKSAQVSKLISCNELNFLVFKELLFESIPPPLQSFRIETFKERDRHFHKYIKSK